MSYSEQDQDTEIEEVREKLLSAKSVVVLSGAGISAESGVPTFRGDDGLWNNYRAEDLATPGAFGRDPELVWRWYDWRRTIVGKIEPNKAHYALVDMEKDCEKLVIVTQNVDGLHELAGSSDILELHGNIWHVRCTLCRVISQNRDVPIEILPHCHCGGLLRPHIVWFGESLDPNIIGRAFNEAKNCDFMFVIGTSGIVQPAASLAGLAKENGAYLVEINIEPTALTGIMDKAFHGLELGKAGLVVPKFT